MSASQDPLEAAILNGSLFRGPRTPSPTRSDSTASPVPSPSASPSPSGSGSGSDGDGASPRHTSVHFRRDRSQGAARSAAPRPARRTGPQTGVKGVRADRAYASAAARERRGREVEAANERMARMALVGRLTAEEEEEELRRSERGRAEREAVMREGDAHRRLRGDDGSDGEGDAEATRRWREARLREMRAGAGAGAGAAAQGQGLPSDTQPPRRPRAHFGHLREVDERGYVKAVEDAGDATAVVVHIYSKLVPACQRLTSSLASLARLYPSTRFLQVRALSIGFGLSAVARPATLHDPDSDSDWDSDLTAAEHALREREAEESIGEVLPTLLIYKGGGDLVGNLVRVDITEGELWRGGGEEGVLAVLRKYGAVLDDSGALGAYSNSIRDRLGLSDDGDDGDGDDYDL